MKEYNMVTKEYPGTRKVLYMFFWAILFFALFYMASAPVLALIDNSTSTYIAILREYDVLLRIVFALLLSVIFLNTVYGKNDVAVIGRNWIIIIALSFAWAGILSILVGNSEVWFLKYLTAVFTGSLVYILNKRTASPYAGFLSGTVAVLAILVGEHVAYLSAMDPPDQPSILYIRSFDSPLLWGVLLLMTFIVAYILARGFLTKHFLKN